MTFSQALRAMKRGERIKRVCWGRGRYFRIVGEQIRNDFGRNATICHEYFLATDWVIVRKRQRKTIEEAAKIIYEGLGCTGWGIQPGQYKTRYIDIAKKVLA